MAAALPYVTPYNLDEDAHVAPINNSDHPEAFIEQYNLTRQVNCEMNPTKQLDKVINDANLPPISMEVNNSGYNVNIKCTSGTYAELVKPAFQTLSQGYSVTVDDVIVLFNAPSSSKDLNGFDFNDIYKVNLSTLSSPTTIRSTITITLHHSSRLVQVQGPGNVHDMPAPAWLSDKCLVKFLNKYAKERQFEIDRFNEDALRLLIPQSVVSSPTCCAACLKKFSASAKPLQCSACKAFFH